MNNLAVSKCRAELFERGAHGGDVIENLRIGQDRDIIFREIDPGLEERNQVYQLLLDRMQAPRERAFELLCRHFRLIQSLRVDQIPYGFGLREIDAPVEKRAHGELSGLGQPRSGSDAEFDDVPEHHGRSMRRDFDDVVGGVGMRLGEVCDDDFVDALCRLTGFD